MAGHANEHGSLALAAGPRVLAAAQGVYLIGTGVWPIVHRGSFEGVTGRKHDFWLVRTVGGLAAAIGGSLLFAAARGRKQRETTIVALTSGLVFGIADLRAAKSYSRIYLGDALLQIAFARNWFRSWESESTLTPSTRD